MTGSNAQMFDLALVGCSAEKAPTTQAAGNLYTSPLFRAAFDDAQASHGNHLLIISAKVGAVHPTERVAPYDLKLTSLPKPERMAWGRRVVEQVRAFLASLDLPAEGVRLVVYAGKDYAEPIRAALPAGWEVAEPMEGLAVGERLQWLKRRRVWREQVRSIELAAERARCEQQAGAN